MATVPLFDELVQLVAEQSEETVIDLGSLSFVDAVKHLTEEAGRHGPDHP